MINVFEFLGLAKDHRTDKKVVQLVKHFDDVNPKAEQGVYHKKVKFPMYAQCKKDGVYAMVVKLPKEPMRFGTAIFGRTGKMLRSTGRLVNDIEHNDEIASGIYIAELCSDLCSLEVLSGIVNPNRVNELDDEQKVICADMQMYYHDFLTIEEFTNGRSDKNYCARWMTLNHKLPLDENILSIDTVYNEKELRDYAEHMICCGQEGAVFKQDVEWLAGAKDWHMMKIVRGIHVDLLCIGWEEGTGKYTGLVANLLFRYDKGKTVKAMLGKGWTHEMAREMYLNIHYGESVGMPEYTHKDDPHGKIYHVYGLQPSSKNGVIRLPKVAELRHDKFEPDF